MVKLLILKDLKREENYDINFQREGLVVEIKPENKDFRTNSIPRFNSHQ